MYSKFDWNGTIARRPVFTVDYWPGTPAVDCEGRKDISWDLVRIRAFADPAGVRTLNFVLGGGLPFPHKSETEREASGGFQVPDLISASDAEIEQWQEETKSKLEPLFRQYREHGLSSILMSQTFQNSGRDSSPEWYHKVSDWEECDLDGRPLSRTGNPAIPCMTNPKLYEVADRYWRAVSFLKDSGVLLGACVDNEPNLRIRGLGSADVPKIGGNPFTQRAFSDYLTRTFGSVEKLNGTAGTGFDNFGQVKVSNENWLVRTMLRRFLSTIVIGIYQRNLAEIAKRHVPGLVAITRLVSGYWRSMEREDEGAEGYGVEATYLKDSKVDIIAWSHIWEADDQSEFLGQLQVTAGLLRGTGKPFGVTEPMVARYGMSHTAWRPQEVAHYVWRGLFYNLRMYNVHSWDRTGDWAIYNEPFGMALSKRPGYLKTVRDLRDELDWISPYRTFGSPVMPCLRILVSRNARYYPGMGGYLYQNWMRHLARIMEFPEYTGYEILEEQTSDVEKALEGCKGLVVVDACLEPATRRLIREFVGKGGRLLVIGPPSLRDALYEEQEPLDVYPVRSLNSPDLCELEGKVLPEPLKCRSRESHPIWPGTEPIELSRPVGFDMRPGSKVVASYRDEPVAAAHERVFYLSGFPFRIDQQKKLLKNFSLWCGIELPQLVVSRFQRAAVVQNWDPRNHRYDGSIIDAAPWTGSIRLPGADRCQIRELRQDHPWLAYHVEGGETVLEGVRVEPLEIRAFRREEAAELPHFEGLPDSLGFTYWWQGKLHPATGRFRARADTRVSAGFVSRAHREAEIGWFVVVVGGKRIAEGSGFAIDFHVSAGVDCYLTTCIKDHPLMEQSPLYNYGTMG